MKLWHKVTIGLFLGIIFGLVARDLTVYLKPIGDLFINLIKMIVVPLVFFSLITGITSISDSKTLGRIGMKASFAFLFTTAFAIVIGLTTALVMKPGKGISLNFGTDNNHSPIPVPKSIVDVLMDIVPSNAIGAMAEGKIVQVVFFSIFTGITLNLMGKQGKALIEISQQMASLVFKMIGIIIEFSPYGAFALTAWVVGTQGFEVLQSLLKLISAVLIACLMQYIVFGLLILIIGRVSPMPFYRKSIEYQSLAFSTSSSKATLATTMRVCQNKLGVSNSSTSFILPLGAAINMDGMAIYLGMCAIFFAQASGVVLAPHDYVMVVLTATLGSIGAAGIPGGSMVMLPMVLSSINLPIEGVALIAGVDRVLDMLRTTVNITGDATITLLIDRSERKLNTDTYYSK